MSFAEASPLRSKWIYDSSLGGYVIQRSRSKQSNEQTADVTPFISKDKTLTLQVVLRKQELKITDNGNFGIAEMNPSTMDLCSIVIGSPVIATRFKDSNKRAAMRAWPSASVSPGRVAMSKDSFSAIDIQENEYVNLTNNMVCVKSAKHAYLLPASNIVLPSPSHVLENYLSHILQKRFFINYQLFMVEYFGCKIWCRIQTDLTKQDNCSDNSSLSVLSDCQADISNELDKITINDEQNSTVDELIIESEFRPREVLQITSDTKVHLSDCKIDEKNGAKESDIKFSDVGGLTEQVTKLKKLVELPLCQPRVFIQSGIMPPTGTILYGPSGTGKTLLLQALINNLPCSKIHIKSSDLLSKGAADGELILQRLFNSARKSAPALISIENVDLICGKKVASRLDNSERLDFALIDLLDQLSLFNKTSENFVVVLATTNSIEALNPMLLRTQRFECEIEIPIPSPSARQEILTKELQAYQHSLKMTDIEAIAEKSHGYVGSDIAAVCKEAGRAVLERSLSTLNSNENMQVEINIQDIESGLKKIPPSAIRELIVQVPKVMWTDIGGNDEVKIKLRQTVEWPLKHPEAFQRLGIQAPSGVLLYGPPGCSKTLTAKALATESGLNFISIKGPELFSKYVGDSEKAIRKIFAKARAASPSIIFIDEMDALAGERMGKSSNSGNNVSDRVLATLLTELDGVEGRQDVILVGATNRPDKIDKALLRPGRIDRIIHVPLPDPKTRKDIFNIVFKKTPVSQDVDLNWLVTRTDRYSGAEICAVCHEAGLAALEHDMNSSELNQSDFESALSSVRPQTSREVVQMYQEYGKTFKLN